MTSLKSTGPSRLGIMWLFIDVDWYHGFFSHESRNLHCIHWLLHAEKRRLHTGIGQLDFEHFKNQANETSRGECAKLLAVPLELDDVTKLSRLLSNTRHIRSSGTSISRAPFHSKKCFAA